MARNISKESLEQKIAKTEKAISKNREQYDRLTAELEELHKKQKAIQSEELLKAIEGKDGRKTGVRAGEAGRKSNLRKPADRY